MPQTKSQEEIRDCLDFPSKYKVILHNDDYTTMEFVTFILRTVFYKSELESQDLMLKVHKEGRAICGIFIYEVAETKVQKVTRLAKENGYPLKCTMEKQ